MSRSDEDGAVRSLARLVLDSVDTAASPSSPSFRKFRELAQLFAEDPKGHPNGGGYSNAEAFLRFIFELQKQECLKLGAAPVSAAQPLIERWALHRLACRDAIRERATSAMVTLEREDVKYLLDRSDDVPSPLVLLDLIGECVDDGKDYGMIPVGVPQFARFACFAYHVQDRASLDPQKVFQRLKALGALLARDGVDPALLLGVALWYAGHELVQVRRSERNFMARAKDPDFRLVFLDTPQKAYGSWNASVYSPNREDLDATRSIESAVWFAAIPRAKTKNSLETPDVPEALQAIRGCDKSLRDRIQQHILALHATRPEQVLAYWRTPSAHRLVAALASCELIQGHSEAAKDLLALPSGVFRGPRHYAGQEAEAVALQIAKKNDGYNLQAYFNYRFSRRDLGEETLARLTYLALRVQDPHFKEEARTTQTGLVGSATTTNDVTNVVFAPSTDLVPNVVCSETNRVAGVRWENDHSRIVYEESCVDKGMKRIDATPPPVTLPAAYAKGLKAGMLLTVRTRIHQNRQSFVVSAFTGPKKDKLVMVDGFAVGE